MTHEETANRNVPSTIDAWQCNRKHYPLQSNETVSLQHWIFVYVLDQRFVGAALTNGSPLPSLFLPPSTPVTHYPHALQQQVNGIDPPLTGQCSMQGSEV